VVFFLARKGQTVGRLNLPKAVVGVVVCLLVYPAICAADPIEIHANSTVTSGTMSAVWDPRTFSEQQNMFALFGPDFTYSGEGFGGSVNALTVSFGNQRAGDPIGVFGQLNGGPATFTYQGVTYTFDGQDASTYVTVTSPTFTLPTNGQQVVDFTLPFSMTGLLGFSRGGGPTFEAVFLNVTGSGVAHGQATLDRLIPNVYLISRVDYTFTSAAPTPEPGTLLLLGTGMVIVARSARKRMRRLTPSRPGALP
jgi:hypothetical protein